jgi:hypothetical protein
MKKITTIIFAGALLLSCIQVKAQSDTTDANNLGASHNFFSGFSSGYSGTSPKVTAKSYHLGFTLGNDGGNYWDLYLFNSVPTVAPADGDTIEYMSNDLRRQIGGIANFALSKTAFFGNGSDKTLKDIKGFQTDFRVGVKLVDTPIRRAGRDFLIPVFQSTFDIRYLIPLIPPRKLAEGKTKVDVRKSMVGNLSFRISGAYESVLNTSTYNLMYASRKGILPNPNFLVLTPEMSLYVTNQFYFGVGYAYNNVKFISNNFFFSINYGRQKSSGE